MVKALRVQVYVEGGGPTRHGDLADECRKGFSALLEKATDRKVGITACGSRNEAYRLFKIAVEQRKHDLAILLVDSEEIVRANDSWTHVELRDKWPRFDAPVHLMVVTMEAWLLADQNALEQHFGKEFAARKIPSWPKLWEVDKNRLNQALEDATKDRKKGGPYDKGRDSFKILARVDPKKLEACPHARKLFDELKAAFAGSPAGGQ